MTEKELGRQSINRRKFMEGCAASLVSVQAAKALRAQALETVHRSAVQRTISLDQGWLFGGPLKPGASDAAFDDAAFSRVVAPNCVAPLSWQKWDPATWENVSIYRRHFSVPADCRESRLFLHFDRVMAGATLVVNGHSLEPHLGGFLPFEREITGLTRDGDNVLAVAVDGRWLNVPPSGSSKGVASVDYLLPAGLTGSVSLRAVPKIFLREVFAKPVDVLSPRRRVDITCRVDAAVPLPARIRLKAELRRNGVTVGTVTQSVQAEKPNQDFSLSINDLKQIKLWDPEHPHLYEVVVTLFHNDRPVHHSTTRIGFRDARFELDGFFMNGKRLQLFGLNRHELYPYVGFAAPERLLRRDATILRRQFNCNSVRCSHYPQSEAFLDACDELGLMVWEELPGWQYIGDESWQQLALRDVEGMIRRDRNHPSIIIWGVRINESPNVQQLYRRTSALAKSLDDSRPTSGSMTPSSRKNWEAEWDEDVFAFDDYHADPVGTVGILPPVEGHPYMLAEAVGQFNYHTGKGFAVRYRRAGDIVQQTDQALFHAQAHDKTAGHKRIAGAIAWCAFDYGSLLNDYDAVKCPGIADVFRIPKLGATFYLTQVDPALRPMIEPNFYWDFGPKTPSGPGAHAAIFSNCERLELAIDGKAHATLHPDRAGFPNLKYPPFFADLELDGSRSPELSIDGYVGSRKVLSRSFSSDRAHDRLRLEADDAELKCDGADATRVAFAVVDRFGAPRAFAEGEVTLHLDGPGTIVGDNPFSLAANGGAGAVYIRTLPGRTGRIAIEAKHSTLPGSKVTINVRQPIAATVA